MSGPRLVGELIAAWSRGIPQDQALSLQGITIAIQQALARTRGAHGDLDRRCMALVITRLEEAEHWALAAMREAVDRADRERGEPS